jgi:hypothetical protein
MRTIKKAQSGVKQKPVRKISVDNTSTGPKRDVTKDIRAERTAVANKNKAITNSYNKKSTDYKNDSKKLKQAAFDFRYEQQMGDQMGRTPERSQELAKFAEKEAKTKDSLSTVYSKKAKESVKNPKYKPALKNGGSVGSKVVKENPRQQKRLSRIKENNPERAERVEKRMVKRADRAMGARGAASRMKSGGKIKKK